MTRRGPGEGSIHQRKDGRWARMVRTETLRAWTLDEASEVLTKLASA
jgi:hypothetical protein